MSLRLTNSVVPTAIVATCLLVGGCSISNLIGQETATKTTEFTVPIPASGKCVIRGENGRVKCVAAAVTEISVAAEITARAATVEQAESLLEQITVERAENNGIAELSAKFPPGVSGSVSWQVTVPAELVLDLHTSNGAIDVTGVSGDVKGHTSNGATRLTDCRGAIDVRTSNGKISLEGKSLANVRAKTSNGSVQVKGSLMPGTHQIETSNGSINIDLTGNPVTIMATTSNGSVTADGRKLKKGEAVTLGRPGGSSESSDDSDAKLALITSNGSIRIKHAGSEASPQEEPAPAEAN